MNAQCEICQATITTNQLCCPKCFRLAPWELRHEWETARHFGPKHQDVAGRKILDFLRGKKPAAQPVTDNQQPTLL